MTTVANNNSKLVTYFTGALYGVFAFLAGITLTWITERRRLENEDTGILEISVAGLFDTTISVGQLEQGAEVAGADGVEPWEFLVWLYHDAHGASLDVEFRDVDGLAGAALETVEVSFVDSVSPLIPIVVLVVAGFVFCWNANVSNLGDGVIAGISVLPGYFVLAVVTAIASSGTISVATVSLAEMSIDLSSAVVYTGIVFPLIFGALGGALSAVLDDTAKDSKAE